MFKSIIKNIIFIFLLLLVNTAYAKTANNNFWSDYIKQNQSGSSFGTVLDTKTLSSSSGKLATLKQLQETVNFSQKLIRNVCDVRFLHDVYDPNDPYFKHGSIHGNYEGLFLKSGDYLIDGLRGMDREIEYRQWAQNLPNWRAKVQQNIQASFPGSNLDCGSRSGSLVAGNTTYIYSNGIFRKLIEQGQILAEVAVSPKTYTVIMTFGSEKSGFVMPISNPQNAYFVAFSTRVDASQSDTASESTEAIIKNNDQYTRSLHTDSHAKKLDMMSQAMNAYYNANFNTQGVTMTDFLKMFLVNPDFRNNIVASYQN